VRRTLILTVLVVVVFSPVRPAVASGTWTWPVSGPVTRGYDAPVSPYGTGHRGIDIAAPVGTVVVAPAAGIVSFAGSVGGHLFLSIDHGGGVVSSCSWLLALLVEAGDVVAQGQPVASSGTGHPQEPVPHVHFGVRLNGAYVDPMDYLEPVGVVGLIRLAPIEPSGPDPAPLPAAPAPPSAPSRLRLAARAGALPGPTDA
jgi:murein DD-endopeptidase MepM/ murein hydrolase activator NlpD